MESSESNAMLYQSQRVPLLGRPGGRLRSSRAGRRGCSGC